MTDTPPSPAGRWLIARLVTLLDGVDAPFEEATKPIKGHGPQQSQNAAITEKSIPVPAKDVQDWPIYLSVGNLRQSERPGDPLARPLRIQHVAVAVQAELELLAAQA